MISKKEQFEGFKTAPPTLELSEEALKLRESILKDGGEMSAGKALLLDEALFSLDRAKEARRIISKQGLMIES